ncbi:hypothetical protein [Idiomarina sp. OXR-189]|uniref:hypothetical protein n=1 Tax=Idiomarina sp. OXR-189 TaxID=3100175 RepID=UPI002AC9EB7A|nr:hypothetical protein [Idiomarina sp. OXR-189]WPZ01525.1 hypothetical protein UM402_01055 [Idiomarina sp. OXR-189]
MGRIRQRYLDQVKSLVSQKGEVFPVNIEITDTGGKTIAKGEFHSDGEITVYSNPSLNIKSCRYENPSAMRQDIVASNCATYKYIKYKGKTLSEHGVSG